MICFKASKRTINLKTWCNVGIYYVTDFGTCGGRPFYDIIRIKG